MKFQSSSRIRKVSSNIEGDQYFEQPRFPDFILNENYSDKLESSQRKMVPDLFPAIKYNDDAFKIKGKHYFSDFIKLTGTEILTRILKCFILRNRLLYSWIETGTLAMMIEVILIFNRILEKGH